jgi:heme-degrading monooxygenase HmoA
MFVAINNITCKEEYKSKFEMLFATRAKAIDLMPGFRYMHVLRPMDGEGDYLIVSHWDTADHFKRWTTSPAFIEGHKRGFEDIAKAKREGKEPPMKSDFKTYEVISE